LRALYEQYFLGFEKIEPAVARKDVDRRIYVLRREKIRNTGKRFKLQTIIQRYNTFQQYWQRICREIENGTYKRHVLRAERQMTPEMQLTIAAKRRFGKLAAAGDARSEAAASAQDPPTDAPPGGFTASEAPTEIMPRADDAPVSDDFATRRPAPRDPASDQVPRRAPPPKPERARPLSSQPAPRAEGAGAKLESLELDMGFLGSWAPPPPKGAPKAKSSPQAAPSPKPKSSPRAAPPPRPVAPPRPAATPPRPAASPPRPAASPPRPAASPPPPAASPPPPAAPPPRPAAPPPPPAAPPPRPAAPPPKPVARPAESPRAGLSDDRVKDLHDKLSALKKENREAGQVSLESLKKTLRDAEDKLRQKHQGKRIDFEVVIRDGKAIVKPTVR
jgi:hypothetical protein